MEHAMRAALRLAPSRPKIKIFGRDKTPLTVGAATSCSMTAFSSTGPLGLVWIMASNSRTCKMFLQKILNVNTINAMQIEFDPAKDSTNTAKHGASLALASQLEWGTALVWTDSRKGYSEARQSALGIIGERVYFVAFVDRVGVRRVISLRKANDREVMHYANTFKAA